MPGTRLLSRAALTAGVAAVLASAGIASAEERSSSRQDRSDSAPYARTAGSSVIQRQIERSTFSTSGEEASDPAGLPPRDKNIELVSKLSPTGGPGGSIAPGQIADIAVHKNAAYLMSWSEPGCQRGGFFSVDISDPARPRELKFVPALPDTYHGEGAHAVAIDTPAFRGDVLVTNNEPCTDEAPGGFDLYDVTNPADPKPLVQGAGDFGDDDGTLEAVDPVANSSHSSFLWQDGGRAFLVIVDNEELHDVDIFDVTNPRAPRPVGEFDLVAVAESQGVDILSAEQGNGGEVFLHDMVVKEINGRQTMLASYWDAGYIQLDVEDPSNPKILSDTDFTGKDPETGSETREGNAHQAEFSRDNRYILAADEDFAPYRPRDFQITSGADAGDYPATEVGGGTSVASLPDGQLNGPTVYGGYGCPDPDGAGPRQGSDPIPPRDQAGLPPLQSGEEAIVVLQRGPNTPDTGPRKGQPDDPENPEESCFPGEKAAQAQAAGYDAVLIVNRHTTGGAEGDSPFCGSGGYPQGVSMVTLCSTHETYHRLFDTEPQYDIPYNDAEEPDVGDVGERILGTADFDGWGYAHLYDTAGGKMREVDTYAIPEANDPRFAFGFGDLSIHEWATDPDVDLAYGAYYAGGLRVVSFGESGIREVGSFIDDAGNNFWGVEQFTDRDGNRLIAASDRDFGLYVFRYTGPGAAPRRVAPATATQTQPAQPAQPAQPGPVGPRVRISNRALRLSRAGLAAIRLACPSTARSSCRGAIRLVSGRRRIGARTFTLDAGRSAFVRVKWNRAAIRELRRRKSMRVQVTVDATDAGGVRGTNTRRITVRPHSAKAPSSRPR